MQFIRLPEAIDIAGRVLPEMVAEWVDKSINIIVLHQLQINMLVSWIVVWLKSGMPHWHTVRNIAHWAWAIYDWSNQNLFRIIPNPGSQKLVTLSLEFICTILFQAMASDVNKSKLRQYSSNHVVPCFVNVFNTFWGTCDWPIKNPGKMFRYLVDMFLNIPKCEIQRPDMLITQKMGQMSLVGCTYDCHKCRSWRTLIMCILPPITCIYLAADSTTLRVSKAPWFRIVVWVKRMMWKEEVYAFGNIPVE